jgi:hypothetical protein
LTLPVKILRTGLLTLLLIAIQLSSAAQAERVALRNVLRSMEQQYGVSFTFLDEDIKDVFIEPPADSAGLSSAVQWVSEQTGLIFSSVDKRFIAIQRAANRTILLCGRLMDRETGEPVADATVQTGSRYTTTDVAGRFQISALDSLRPIVIRSLGYPPLTLKASELTGAPCRDLFMTIGSNWLPEILIANYPTLGISKLSEGSYSIQTKSLGILPGLIEPDVLFAAQTLPGVQSIDETVSNINVRSGTQDQNLLLWDGIRMYQPGHFFGLISAFNPQVTESVQLTKNGTTAKYGEGVSSVIDIRPNNAVSSELSGSAGINLLSADAVIQVPLSSKSSAQIAFRRSLADIVTTAPYRKYYDRAFQGTLVTAAPSDSSSRDEQFVFYDLSAKYLLDLTPRDKLRLTVFQAKNTMEIASTVLPIGETRISSLDQHSTAAGLSYNRHWSSRLTTSAFTYVSSYELNSVNQDIPRNQELRQGNEVLDLGLRLEGRILVNNRLDVLAGYQFSETGVTQREEINNPPFQRNKKEVLRTHSLYAETSYTSSNRFLSVRLGLRANGYDKLNAIRLEPRLSVSTLFSDRLTLELLAEMKSQTMVQVIDFQNDFLGVEKRKWVIANDLDIPWVKSKQVSLGMHFQQEDFLVSAEIFGKWVDDILSSSQGFQDHHQYVRTPGKYNAFGADMLVSRKLNAITFWTGYSYSISDYTFDLFTPSQFRNNYDIRHRVTIGLTCELGHWELALGLNWRTGKPYTPPLDTLSNAGIISYGDPNSARLPTYARVDFSARYKFMLSKRLRATAGLSIWNLLDRDNVVNIYFIPGSSGKPAAQVQKALSITPNLVFRVEF